MLQNLFGRRGWRRGVLSLSFLRGQKWSQDVFRVFIVLGLVFLINEIVIYPVVIFQCSWPSKPKEGEGGDFNNQSPVVKAMFLADTHLLGPLRGHWFDKLRREWQMHRAFQTAIQIFKPEVVFFLGDLFDEGEWVTNLDFDKYVARFENLFSVPEHIHVHVVQGNHDIGFHYQTKPHKHSRFKKAFNSSSVSLLRLKDINFVLVNSMAMEMDNCFLCNEGLAELIAVERMLFCQKQPTSKKCTKSPTLQTDRFLHSPPILLQHFPMYRKSDSSCIGDDSAPEDEKLEPFRPTLECLAEDSSNVLLKYLMPRLILSAHTHHYCVVDHFVKEVGVVPEYSVPSFSWRNRNNPSFFLGHFTRSEFHLSKCLMPQESTANALYVFAVLLIVFIFIRRILICFNRCPKLTFFRRS